MNSVEKRHSSRRSSGHRKHSDGGYSDTSSAGSFPDETDREVSNLTDRAFRSLCIGDEAVYNDSDLSVSSPSTRTERQQAFFQSGRNWPREDAKGASRPPWHGQGWLHGAETQGDPSWAGGMDGRTGGRASATFQQALVHGPPQQRPLDQEQPCLYSNGAPEFSTQERRSRSRVSSLIKAFNSDGCRDGAVPDGKLKEWNSEANWDRSALMSIQREISEFSTDYGQNLNSGHFPPADPYSQESMGAQESFYSSQVATAHMDSTLSSSFFRSSHSQQAAYGPSANVFIHSEFSPFRVWQAPDRFPFRHRDVPGYTIRSDFQSWYETPLYKELSLGPQAHRAPAHEQWAAETPVRIALEHGALPAAPRSSSTSTVLHKASAVQKRCESEFAEFHHMRKRTQSLGTNKLPSQRPSTVSPTNEVSRRGLLNSATDLQRFRMTTAEHSVTAETVRNPHGELCRNDGFLQFSNSSTTGEQVVGGDTCTEPFNISQPYSAESYSHQEVRTSEIPQAALSPPAMEHAPVRAESRGAMPDTRLSSYKARATSLLFNLKDNRKRVKSTYSPPKFKGLENFDRSKPVARNDGMEHRDTVINIPDYQDSELQVPQEVMQQGGPPLDPHAASHHPSTGYNSPWVAAFNPHLSAAYKVQSSDYIPDDYLAPPSQSEMLLHDGFNSYSQDGYRSSPLSQGYIQQQECVPSFANDMHANKYQQSSISNTINMAASAQPESVYSAADSARVHVGNTNHTAYQMNTESEKQWFNESMRGEMAHVDRYGYEQVKDNQYDFTDLSSNDSWKHHCRDKETPCVNDKPNPPWQTEAPPMSEEDQNAQFYPEMYMWSDIPPQQKYGSSSDWNMSSTGAQDHTTCDESKAEGFPVYPQTDGFYTRTSVNPQLSNQPHQVQQYSTWGTQSAHGDSAANEQLGSASQDYGLHNQQDGIKDNSSSETYPRRMSIEREHATPKSYSQDGHGHDDYMFAQESLQMQQDVQVLEKADKLREPQDAVKQQYELNLKETTSTSDQMQCIANTSLLNNQDQEKQVNVKENTNGEQIEKPQIQTQLSQQIEWAQTLQTKLESVRAGLTEDTGTCRATEERKEQLTERISGGGRPHVEQTIMNKLKVVQSKDVNAKAEEDKQLGAQQAGADQGLESQHNKDDGTMVELRERSTAGEAEVEVIQKECIETITLSPDGEAKGEAIAWRDLGAEQAKEGQKQAEPIPANVIKTKLSEQVQIETGAPVEHIKAQLSKTEMEKAKPSKMETKSVHSKVDIKEKGKDEVLRAEKIDADPSKEDKVKPPFRTKQAEKAKGKREEKAKEELNKVLIERDEQTNSAQVQVVKPEKCGTAPARIEYAKIDKAKEKREKAKTISEKRMEHSVESLLIRKAQKDKLKQEPNRVEKVKTELAEAKAEFGKMREEQKRKQTHAVVSKAVVTNIVQKEKEPTPHQQFEETPVIVPVDEYERVREKYGFSKTLSTNGKAVSGNNVTSPSQEMERSQPHSDKGEEASDYSKARDEESSQSKAATQEEGKKPSAKDTGFSEDCYVYSETSKEFKLSNPNYSSSSLVTKQTDGEMCIDKNTKDNGLIAKTEPVSANIDVSRPGVSNINPTKSLTHERKPNPNKDSHATPPRTLTHKERTQTKQEILTSKIKAHAEKEISAIKEKHLASGKIVQQRRPSQELTKPPDKNISHSVAPRDQQATAHVKASIPEVSGTTAAVASSKPTPSLPDGQVHKQGPSKSVQNTVIKQALISNQTRNNDKVNEELKARETTSGTKAVSLNTELKSVSHGKEEVMKLNVVPQAAEHINPPQKTKAGPPPSAPEEGSQHETPPTPDRVTRETQERPEVTPSIKFVFDQNEPPANDDSLQIMGIMVTVREKTVSINDEDGGPIRKALEKAEIDSEINDNIKPAANLRVETTTENIKFDVSNARAEEEKLFVLSSQPTVGIVPSKVGANNHPENKPEETTDRLENKMAGLTDKRLTRQEESSLMRKTSNSHAAHQEDPVAHKEDSSTVMKPAPNKPGKTQPILFKQGKITEKAKIYTNKNSNEAKSNIKTNVEVGNDPSLAKVMETESNPLISSLKNDTKSSKCNVPSTKTEKVQDGGSVPLLADKGTYSLLPGVDQQNKHDVPPNLKGPENIHISLGKEAAMTPREETHPDDGNVHIGCIAIRVVPGAIEQDNQEKAGTKQVAIQSLAETMNTERDTDRALPLTPAIKPSNEDVVQQVQHLSHDTSSSGYAHQSSTVPDSSKTTKNDTVDQATEEEYFQFQGVTEINQEQNDARLDRAGMQGLPKEHTGELGEPKTPTSGDVTSLHSDNNFVKREEQKAKQVTIEDKVLDNTSKTSMESSSATAEHMSQIAKSEQESKKSHVLPEKQSNQKVQIEKEEVIQNLKQATPNTFHAHIEERHGVRDSHTAKNSTVSASKEHPHDKQEAKPKPRVSTIPEISAIADYARLKVIVADDGPDTIQEFPPNKKEGFFPMIQSRPSRRPVFTAEATERQTVHTKMSSKEPEARPKVNKEPKSLVFSTMEQDHKRTGMFKLREKENVPSDVKTKDKSGDGKTHAKGPTATPPPEVSEDFKYFSQDTATVEGAAIISPANVKRADKFFSQYSDQPNNFTTTERPEGGEAFAQQRMGPQMDNTTHKQALFGKLREPNRGERSSAMVNEAKSTEEEREKAAKQKQEYQIIQQIDEERRATLESQRREERRTREREARAARIEEERRETQRRAEIRAEEERVAQLLKEKAAKEEMEKKREEKRVAEEERRKKQREEERRKKETEERIAAQIQEEMRRAKRREEEERRAREEEEEKVRRAQEEETRAAKEVEDKKRDRRREEDRRAAQIQEERRAAQIEEERREREEREERARAEEEQRRARHMEIEQRIKEHEEKRAAELEEEKTKRKQGEARRQEASRAESKVEVRSSVSIEAEQPLQKVVHEEPQPFQVEVDAEHPPQKVEQRKAALLRDALQYYAIASSDNSKDKHPQSPVPPVSRVEPTRQASTLDESLSRPHEQSSPALAPPRSTTCSPAPGPKPTLFRVKDNTFRASSLTKSVKPRLHKSFGEDFRVGSPQGERRGPDRVEDERDRGRRSAGTPVYQDTVTRQSGRAPAVKELAPPQPQPPPYVPEHRAARAEGWPYSRRSMAAEEDDSRSCVSNMSEDVESFATSAGDMSDFRSSCDYDRPESACSFSSDVGRSLGKPPSVPPKSDKALRRAQRLTTRRMKKESPKTSAEVPVPEENPHRSAGSSSSSSASELRHSYRHARASPHFSAPFSLTHAPASASSAASSDAEAPSAYRHPRASLHANSSITSPHDTLAASPPGAYPHATAPVSIPALSPHAGAPAYQPVPSPHCAPPPALPVAPKALASTPSSPVLRRHANPAGPVKQYHVEPGYSQSYPLTQPKVLQDPGSGQYYVVDMPVQVKTKTFFDPETGKYVQLNVRQTDQGGFRPLPQPAGYPQPLIPQPHLQVQAPPQVYPQVATPGKSFVVYPGYPPGRQSMPVATLPPQRSYSGMSIPDAPPHTAQSAREGQNDGYNGYNSEETPYMDTAYESDTICDTHKVNRGPHEKHPEGDTNSHLQGGSLGFENNAVAQSSLQQRDIITMSELEDFMDVSDW